MHRLRSLLALLSLSLFPAASMLPAAEPAAPAAEKAPTPKTYPLRGVVVAIDSSASTARIKHEKIPGFMGAMTMQFHLTPAALKTLAVGQTITATLYLDDGDFWLRNVSVQPTPAK